MTETTEQPIPAHPNPSNDLEINNKDSRDKSQSEVQGGKKEKSKKTVPKTHVSEAKLAKVKELVEAIKTHRTIMMVSVKSLPSPQLQKIKKDIREDAVVKLAKKKIILHAIDEVGIPEMEVLREHIVADSAVIFSNKEGFELAAWLIGHRNPIAAKAGQTANEDIHVEPGVTDLMPGPDISVGLKVAVEEGKIAIKEPHIILKDGQEVTPEVASVLLKLGIKPFKIGLNPMVIYDTQDKKIYVGIKINKEETLNDLLTARSKALGFAQSLEYYCKDTIGYFLAKANAHAQGLEALAPAVEEKKEEVVEEKVEETKEADKPAENAEQPSNEGEQEDSNKEYSKEKVEDQSKPLEEQK